MSEAKYFDYDGQLFGGHSYAQHGDDIILLSMFNRLVIPTPSYLDLGASHPYWISNTALLYERGSTGVNVEADPDCIAAFREMRPKDVNVHAGVAPQSGRLNLYCSRIAVGVEMKSLDRKFSEGYGPVTRTVQVPVFTLNDIVRDYCGGSFPDLLSLDIEGLDLSVLETIDFGSTNLPKVICAEAEHNDHGKIKRLLTANGYFLFGWAGANMFFVQDRFKEQVYGDVRTY